MNELINKWYRNHALIYKLLLLLSTTFFIVYLFPKTGKFRYSFEKAKPWQSENLYAPFDFAIKKTDLQISKEKESIINTSEVYFDIDTSIKNTVTDNYLTNFNTVFLDTISEFDERDLIYSTGQKALSGLYENGILNSIYNYGDVREVILVENNNETKRVQFGDLTNQNEIRNYLESELEKNNLTNYKEDFISLFFDIIKSNISFNKSLTDKSLEEKLANVSLTRGVISEGTLIISKGQVIEDDQFSVLDSLKSEYESQVWSSNNYNWVMVAYTLLVALALLMLLLFLRKYRTEVFENNTKVTFIFFNIVVMILLTTLVINYNSEYLYVVPLCILPLVLKAFFDARLGLFAHVLTVLLLGFIVPNSYEYMFLQIIAGIVTILTVSELYKRANLFISVGQITLIYIISYFAFFVIHEGQIFNVELKTFGYFVLGGLATLFVQPLIYIYEKLFGLVSDVSLLELSDTNTKLLKELSNKAPGTFHHSLNVANLAEASANEIGANAMLVRVGALYHDIGKMKNPTFFTENQSTGINPHDELSAKESANVIVNHVLDGIEIAKKNNLPDRVIDFIRTHHGTSTIYYFYMKEKSVIEDADEKDFSFI